MYKKFGIGIAIAAGWAIAWAVKEEFAIPDYAMWLAIISVVGVIFSFQVENRLSALEGRVIRKHYNGGVKLLEGERHKPQHAQPETLVAGGAMEGWIKEPHQILFEDFRWWAPVLNPECIRSLGYRVNPRHRSQKLSRPSIRPPVSHLVQRLRGRDDADRRWRFWASQPGAVRRRQAGCRIASRRLLLSEFVASPRMLP
ncbi:hypothetical protein [Rhizobium jaguaris]|uniref:Uncharacterized protein n=1 Tax=Rhizobium jaguaris TaxID=1312183 RepID=A0A387G0J4_9HYPH|nr:hypothetical protein [Rhizobium jaguaris]AYG64449.1 hypothetical protein CCGE525_37615 [Rhizobium jaguaris]